MAENTTASTCTVLGRYFGRGQASLVHCAHESHNVVFSAAPLPPAAIRALADKAGVHGYLPASTPDGIEVAGAGHMLRGGNSTNLRTISLPHPQTIEKNARNVEDEAGKSICRDCRNFQVELLPGEIKLFFVKSSI